MNEKKVCFIFCSNDQLYTEECLHYINHLNIPEGYEVDALAIEGAVSMTAGYNEGMQASDAKYKVYLHQDVFIVNPDFIQDFIDIFRKDARIGMIGMIGSPRLPDSGIMWDDERCGAIYVPAYNKDSLFRAGGEDALTEVEAVDGLLMITQYDIPWREDLFDKWDFYDCSQSQEFIRRGYRIVVPWMKEPWCLHDSTISYMTSYDGERQKFLREYFETGRAPECQAGKITVILTTYNRKSQLQDTLEWLSGVEGISNIVVADNGSTDGTAEWLSAQSYEYLWFDEGIQGYGKLWNTVLENFETEDHVVFMEAGVYPERESLLELASVLCVENAGIANLITNYYGDDDNRIIDREALTVFARENRSKQNRKTTHRTLSSNWRIWAVRKDVFDKVGLFREELQSPDNVLTDYTFRMIQSNLWQTVCPLACAWESFSRAEEIYTGAVAGRGQNSDENVLGDELL